MPASYQVFLILRQVVFHLKSPRHSKRLHWSEAKRTQESTFGSFSSSQILEAREFVINKDLGEHSQSQDDLHEAQAGSKGPEIQRVVFLWKRTIRKAWIWIHQCKKEGGCAITPVPATAIY